MPVEITIVITQGAEAAAAAAEKGRFAAAGAGGAVFHLTVEAALGFAHKGLPSPDSVMCTTLKAKWLRKPLKEALVAPFLDGLNGARPKGSEKLGFQHVRGVFGAGGVPVAIDVPAVSLITEDGEVRPRSPPELHQISTRCPPGPAFVMWRLPRRGSSPTLRPHPNQAIVLRIEIGEAVGTPGSYRPPGLGDDTVS